ncbi:MAG: gluconokinase [Thermodesulfobacteriota bacterium]
MILIVMGVAGAGKTTVGKLLAEKLGWEFYDADDFHPESNVEKMRQGLSLTDDDRRPWLEELRRIIDGQPGPAVIACSALKQSYRDYLSDGNKEVTFVYLKGSDELIRRRLEGREGHFADARILGDQLQTLEEPENVLTESADREPESIAEDIIGKLNLR